MNRKLKIGQVIHHSLFDYAGVIFRADETFRGSDTWYEQVALTRPPKDQPWYQVLVHRSVQTTYVAERNLKIEETRFEIEHPLMYFLFDHLENGIYTRTNNWEGDEPLLPSQIAKA